MALFSVAFLYTNLWITFFLSKNYVSHVSHVVMEIKSQRAQVCARHGMALLPYRYQNKSYLGSILKMTNMTNKKQKTASSLGFRVSHHAIFHD